MIKKYGLLTAMIVLVLAGCSEAEVSMIQKNQ
ncbi:lipoprotein [Geomicrobium sp. JCM 19039]|nr:lipoprotein [Geomicrobium sp. JCM 19039]